MCDAFDHIDVRSISWTILRHTSERKELDENSLADTPQQNHVAECKNRHILEVARAMLNEKHMPKSYWA